MKIPFLCLCLLALGSFETSAQADPLSAFQLKWTNSKEYLIDMARSMPAEQYDYKPTDRQMTFGEQLLHIRRNMLWLSTEFISDQPFEEVGPEAPTKTEIIRLLTAAFDDVSERVERTETDELSRTTGFRDGTKTKLQILNLIQDHVTHHRGQLIVYLNLRGIDPPAYVGW